MQKQLFWLLLLLLMAGCGSSEPPVINGAVSKPGVLEAKSLTGLNRYNRLVKIADPEGNFLGSLELSGYALRDVLGEVKKQDDDGFNLPLDTFITAKGQSGDPVVFSYGEVFSTPDEGVLLADSAKLILPGKHSSLPDNKNNPTTILLDVKKRDKIKLDSCASCHDGEANQKLYFPKGWLLIAPQDGFGGRYIESPTEISVAQVGIKIKDTRSSGGRDSIVESPVIIGPDNKIHQFSLEDFQNLPRLTMTDAGIGHGKGYRGTNTWEGPALKSLLWPLLPASLNPKKTYILVSAADGYRSTYSGLEVFNHPKCVLLVDRKDGKPLGTGAGLYTTVQQGDFFVDRNVRMVEEIRVVVVE